jgi:hypothetical protein
MDICLFNVSTRESSVAAVSFNVGLGATPDLDWPKSRFIVINNKTQNEVSVLYSTDGRMKDVFV